ncbi:MAG: GC-type dockerin domain-anchored protein, partial [Phycisphaerales bacterium]
GIPSTPIVVSDPQGVFTWRSEAMPAPGFERYSAATFVTDPDPLYGPDPQNPDYLFNSSFTILGAPQTCYPNCDGSTTAPILNVADFSCFLQKYAAGDPYANCDASTTAPVFNVADFSCFLQRYAAGCP